MVPQFVDVSAFQPSQIDWVAYKQWSSQWDGISRVAMRTSYGVGYIDSNFMKYRQQALSANIKQIIYYHYSYPQYNSPIDEAYWQQKVVGNIRSQDLIILDFEEQVPASNSSWAYDWLNQQRASYGQRVGIYANLSDIQVRLQDSRLTQFPLWYANWQYDPNEHPAPPSPWTSYFAVQYTDQATSIPGIPGTVDANIFFGGLMSIPAGWNDDGTTLVAPNSHTVVLGFRDFILNNPWNATDVPLEEEHGVSLVEEYAPSNAGTRQLFLYSELAWSGPTGVYLVPVGRELAGCRAERDILRSNPLRSDIKSFVVAYNQLVKDAG